jgi:signal transduction histidine kinase
MKLAFVLSFVTAIAFSSGALAQDRASLDEAKAMAVKAAEHVRTAGPTKASADFNTLPQWRDRDLYVVVLSNDGATVAHGARPALVGKNLMGLRDPDGKAYVQDLLTVKDADWRYFKSKNPVTNAVEAKSAYAVRVNDLVVMVGAFKQQ